MAEFFTHNAPNFGKEDTIMGPPGTSIADKFRRMALAMSLQAKSVWRDPGHALLPWTRAAGAVAREAPGFISNLLAGRPDSGTLSKSNPRQPNPDASLAGQYVGPNDLIAHNTLPGYIPRQDWQNAVRQDPFADLLGPMQKPAPRQPAPTSGF
jgi:hypothetical protein